MEAKSSPDPGQRVRVLIADDEPLALHRLESFLTRNGYSVVTANDGDEAWQKFCGTDAPRMAILDGMMPGMSGHDLCRKVRERSEGGYTYMVLLTARDSKEDIVAGLEAGADDYVTKPFDPSELRSRIRVGQRILELESALAGKVRELEEAISRVTRLEGLLPICMHCKRIRDDQESWQPVELYVQRHSGATFSHSLCRECQQKHYPDAA